jgi:hypothetical protein
MSTNKTRAPSAAMAVDRFIAVVVLPTPPFWFAIAMMCGAPASDTLEVSDFHDE